MPPLLVESGGLSQLPLGSRHSSLKLPPSAGVWASGLPPQAELLDQVAVPLEVALLQVLQQAAAPADELEQPAARVVVFRTLAELRGERVHACGQARGP